MASHTVFIIGSGLAVGTNQQRPSREMDDQKQRGILHVPCISVTIKMIAINHSHRNQRIAKGWLTVLVSLVTFSCMDTSNPAIESAVSEESPLAEAAADCETALSVKLSDGVSPEKAKRAAEAIEAARNTPCEEIGRAHV